MILVYNPFPLPELQSANDNIEQSIFWLKKFNLVKNDVHAKGIASVGVEYIKSCYPRVKPSQIQDLIDFASWNCILDDFIESGPLSKDLPQLMVFLNTLKYICEEPDYIYPFDFGFFEDYSMTQALVDIKIRIYSWTSSSQINNLMKSLGHFISGLGWESSLRISGNVPDLNTFCAMRTANGGMYMANALAECVNNIELTMSERTDPVIQVITKCILFVLVIDNDIYSYNKEFSSGLSYSNIIDVFQRVYPSSDKRGSLLRTVELRNQCLLCYLALRAKYPSTDERLDLYFQGLEDIISGNLVFGNTNDRYKIYDENALTLPEFTFTNTLENRIFPPKDIPSIAWWWSLLE